MLNHLNTFFFFVFFSFICSQQSLEQHPSLNKVLIIQATTVSYPDRFWEWDNIKFPKSFAEVSEASAYMYAQRHGYDYKLFMLDDEYLNVTGRDNFWIKPLALYRSLEFNNSYYDWVVCLDLDIIFMEPEKSLEEKFIEWNVGTPFTHIDAYIPDDLDKEHNRYPQYLSPNLHRVFNSGLVVWKNSEKSKKVAKEWFDCPKKIPGCERFFSTSEDWGSDQTALNYLETYFRLEYDFNIQRIPCTDGNGFPDSFQVTKLDGTPVSNGNCRGKFVSHFWGLFTKRSSLLALNEIVFHQSIDLFLGNIEEQVTWLPLKDNFNSDAIPDPPIADKCSNCENLVELNLSDLPSDKGRPLRVLVFQVEYYQKYRRQTREWNRLVSPFSAAELSTTSVYSYARRHGYDYKLFINGRKGEINWKSVLSAIENCLTEKDYDIVLFVDFGFIILDSTINVETMLMIWESTSSESRMIDTFVAFDDNGSHNFTSDSRLILWKNPLGSIRKLLSFMENAKFKNSNSFDPSMSLSYVAQVRIPISHAFLRGNNAAIKSQMQFVESSLFKQFMEMTLMEVEMDQIELLPEIVLALPMNPFFEFSLVFYTGLNGTYPKYRELEIQLLNPIETQLKLEDNYMDEIFIRDLQNECIISERIDPDKCKFMRNFINDIIRRRYLFLKKVDELVYVKAIQAQKWKEISAIGGWNEAMQNGAAPQNDFEFDMKRFQIKIEPVFPNQYPAQLTAPFAENTEPILFVTAFKDLGRDNWENFIRTTLDYYQYFSNIAYHLPSRYYLVVFLQSQALEYIMDRYPELRFKKNLVFHDWHSVNDSFYQKYLPREEEIMRSDIYQAKIPESRKKHPEHFSAEYTLMTHSKISFIRKALQLYPNYEYYCWMDFGHLRSYRKVELLPSISLHYERIPKNQATFSVYLIPDIVNNHYNANEMLAYNGHHLFVASHMIFPNAIIFEFENLYEQKLIEWQEQWIADDEQNLLLQLYQENPQLFKLYHCHSYHLFHDHLNKI